MTIKQLFFLKGTNFAGVTLKNSLADTDKQVQKDEGKNSLWSVLKFLSCQEMNDVLSALHLYNPLPLLSQHKLMLESTHFGGNRTPSFIEKVKNSPGASDGGWGQTSFNGDELWPVLIRVFLLVIFHVLKRAEPPQQMRWCVYT